MTTTLVVGATGMTGRSLVDQLLDNNHKVRVVVRSRHKLSAEVLDNPNATVIEASVLDLTDEEMARHVRDCGAVISCLGHVMDFKGMFGEPKRLCTDATRHLCNAIEVNIRLDKVLCASADWQNDEPLESDPQDCIFNHGVCVPR